MNKTPKLLWLDLQTTGLDPEEDLILEVYAELTNPDGLGTIFQYQRVFYHPKYALKEKLSGRKKAKVLDMHTSSGLLKDVSMVSPDSNLVLFQQELISLLPVMSYVMLAGSQVAFDRSFLKAQVPMLETQLHYRMLDTSALIVALLAKGIRLEDSVGEKVHRSRPDVERSKQLFTEAMRFFRI